MDRQNTEKGQIEKKDEQIQNRQIGAKNRQTEGQTDKHDQSPKSLTKCLHDMERKMSN